MFDEELLRQALREEYKREQDTLPSSEELKEIIQVSPEFHEKMARLIKRHQIKTRFYKIAKNTAACLIIITCSFLLLFAINEDVRATCLQWIKTMTGSSMTGYESAAVPGVTQQIAAFTLEYVPEGYALKSSEINELTGNMLYTRGDDQIEFYYTRSDSTHTAVDNEDRRVTQLELKDGTLCDLYKGKEYDSLIWQKKNYNCVLTVSNLTEEELKQIADKIDVSDS